MKMSMYMEIMKFKLWICKSGKKGLIGRQRRAQRDRAREEKKSEQFNDNRSKQDREQKVAQLSQTDRKTVAPLLNSSEQHEIKGDKSTTFEC